jgi:hypothetical protein
MKTVGPTGETVSLLDKLIAFLRLLLQIMVLSQNLY